MEKNDPRSIRLTRFICEFIALGSHSFSIVDEQGFIRLMKEARPEYPLPGRNYFTRKIKEDMYTDVRKAVQKLQMMLNSLFLQLIYGPQNLLRIHLYLSQPIALLQNMSKIVLYLLQNISPNLILGKIFRK